MTTVIAAIPSEESYVWKLSSEEVPHLTVLYLGETTEAQNAQIALFLEHVTDISLHRFGLSVDHRGTLGDKDADVLFFDKRKTPTEIERVRSQLLQDNTIKLAYDSAEQFEGWTPHLTLGYPETPAKEDDREYPGISYVPFDRLALWTGDYDGPQFRLKDDLDLELAMSEKTGLGAFLAHHGIKGMKWGVRRSDLIGRRSLGVDGEAGTFVGSRSGSKETTNKERAAVAAATKHVRDQMLNHETGVLGPEGPLTKLTDKYRSKFPLQGKDLEDYDREAEAGLESFAKKVAPKGASARVFLNGDRIILFVGPDSEVQAAKDDMVRHSDAMDVDRVNLNVVRDENGVIMSIQSDDLTHADTVETFLTHHGIKGMKWGVRRSDAQLAKASSESGDSGSSESGGSSDSSTPRTSADEGFISADAERFIKTHQKDGVEMSDQEIRKAIDRANMVKQYDAIFNPTPDANAELRRKVEALNLQKQYSQLYREAHPPRSEAVKRLVGNASKGGWQAYKTLDKATDGAVSDRVKREIQAVIKVAAKK